MARSYTKGMSLVEALVAVAILLLITSGVVSVYPIFLRAELSNVKYVQATMLLEEGVEAVRIIRDSGWATNISGLTSGTVYRLAFVSSTWTATTTPILVDGEFERTFTLSDVYRDQGANIAASGTLDPKTKRVSVSVAWPDIGGTTTVTIGTYITDLFND